jgi:hypothetical protein
MASTYSTSLKLTLIGDGDQAGIWGQTTNTNLGTLLEQAITGVVTVNMSDANYTLTNFNGVTDEARNAVIVVTGANNAIRDLIPPVVEKLYTIANNTTGGYDIRVIGISGTGVNIPNGVTALVYCNGTNFYAGLSGTSGNFSVNGNVLAVNVTAATNVVATSYLLGNNATITNTMTAANVAATSLYATTSNATTFNGTTANVTTVNATTVNAANLNPTTVTGGTFANATLSNATISSVSTPITVAQGGTGGTTLTANAVVLGNGTSIVQTVAPGASGNVLTSNGSTWTSTAIPSSIPAAGAIGSYAMCAINIAGNNAYPVFGDTYAAGSGTNQVQSYILSNNGGFFNYVVTDNLTGNWRWVAGSNGSNSGNPYMFGLAVRVS